MHTWIHHMVYKIFFVLLWRVNTLSMCDCHITITFSVTLNNFFIWIRIICYWAGTFGSSLFADLMSPIGYHACMRHYIQNFIVLILSSALFVLFHNYHWLPCVYSYRYDWIERFSWWSRFPQYLHHTLPFKQPSRAYRVPGKQVCWVLFISNFDRLGILLELICYVSFSYWENCRSLFTLHLLWSLFEEVVWSTHLSLPNMVSANSLDVSAEPLLNVNGVSMLVPYTIVNYDGRKVIVLQTANYVPNVNQQYLEQMLKSQTIILSVLIM